MFTNKSRVLIFALVLGLVIAGCAPATATPTSALPVSPEADPEPDTPDPNAVESAEVVVYSGRSESLVGPILERYEAERNTDIAVRWGNTAEVAATILEEGDATPADLFYAQDPGGLGAVSDQMTALPQEILDMVDPRFRDPDGRWVGLSGRARVVVYNVDNVDPADLPDDMQGFTDPAWQGRIGWAPTNGSFQTMVTAMRAVWGEEDTRQWLEDILANDPVVYDSNTPIVAAVGAGEVDVGFVNHYYLYRFLDEEGESFPARNYFLPGGGPGSLVMVAGAGVLEASDNKQGAFDLLEFLLSSEAQTYFADQTNEYPLASGVEPSVDLTPLAELNAVQIDLSDLSDLQGTLQLLREVGALP